MYNLPRMSALALMLFSANILSHAEGFALKLTLNDQSTVTYVLEEQPTVTFDDTNIIFTVANASTSYLRSDIVNMTFVENNAGVESTVIDDANVLKYLDNTLYSPGNIIYLYDTEGRLIASQQDILDVKNISQGIYIAKASNQTLKLKL